MTPDIAMAVGTIGWCDLLWGVIQCQPIMVEYGLSGLVERYVITQFWVILKKSLFFQNKNQKIK
jgi:hypothetical protein